MPDGNAIQIRVQVRVVDPSGRGQAGVAVGVAAGERTSGDPWRVGQEERSP